MEKLTKSQEKAILKDKLSEADDLIFKFLLAYAATGLILAFFYDTWLMAIVIGVLNVAGFIGMKKVAPDTDIHRYFASLAFGIFMAQFIYQMHGLFEMHFFAFIGSAILIAYQQWRMQIPITVFVVVHHGLLAWLQYTGVGEVYFTQLSYMSLQTFIIHVILAAVVFSISGLWAYRFKNFAVNDALKSKQLERANKDLSKYNRSLEDTKNQLARANSGLEEEKQKLVDITQKQAEINRKLVSIGEKNSV